MKKLILVALIGMGLSLNAQSQCEGKKHRGAEFSPEEHARRELVKMRDHLNLNDQQIKEIEPLLIAHHKEMMAQKEAAKLRRTELKSKLQDILSDEQELKMKEMHQARKERRKKERLEHREHRRKMVEPEQD